MHIGSYSTQSFTGYIDDFRIYNYAINPLKTFIPMNWMYTNLSSTGQYMMAAASNGGLFLSSNYGLGWYYISSDKIQSILSTGKPIQTMPQTIQVSQQVLQIVSPNSTAATSSTWTANGITWTSSASTYYNADYMSYKAFNTTFDITSRWATSSVVYTSTGNTSGIFTNIQGVGSSIQGEWLQLQSSVPLVAYSYQIASGDGPGTRTAKTFYIIGSNDGTTWYPIQYASGGATFPTSTSFTLIPSVITVNSNSTQTFGSSTLTTTTYSTTTNAYTYFRLVGITVYRSTGNDHLDIGEWFVKFATTSPTVVSSSVSTIGTVSPNSSAATSSTWVTTNSLINTNITWNLSASSYYDSNMMPYKLFNTTFDNASRWASASSGYYTTSGNTSGYYTTIQGIGSIQGDWLQLQSSVPLVAYSYQFASGYNPNARFLKTFYIIGSNDGVTWYPIQYGSVAASPTSTANALIPNVITVNNNMTQTFGSSTLTGTTYSTTTNAYTYFRLLGMSNYSPSATPDYLDIGEWVLNFIPTFPPLLVSPTLPSSISTVSPNTTSKGWNWTWTNNNITWTASSNCYGGETINAHVAFNGTYNNYSYWRSSGTYTTNGNNSGVYTKIQGIAGEQQGDWLQIKASEPLVMSSYQFAISFDIHSFVKTFHIVGSNDEIVWYPIQSGSINSLPTTIQQTLIGDIITVNKGGAQTLGSGILTTTIYQTTGYAYTYFRLICLSNFSGGTVSLPEWVINFSTVASQDTSTNTLAISPNRTVPSYAISTFVSTDSANRTVLVSDNSATIEDIYEMTRNGNAVFTIGGAYILSGVYQSASEMTTNGRSAISNNQFDVWYKWTTGGHSQAVHIIYRQIGGVIDVYQDNARYWLNNGNVNDPATAGYTAQTIGSGGYGFPGITLNSTTSKWKTSNGITWNFSASSTSQNYPYHAFNNSIASSWKSGTTYLEGVATSSTATVTLSSGSSIQGEWIQLQNSTPLVMTSYQFANTSAKTYYILGSNDGLAWYNIHYASVSYNGPYISPNTQLAIANTWTTNGGVSWTPSASANYDTSATPYKMFNNDSLNTTISARYITFQYGNSNGGNARFQNFAELRVYSSSGGSNIIVSTMTVTSKDYLNGDWVPSNFVNGLISTANTLGAGYHSAGTEYPWIKVDLGSERPIYRVELVNRQDCCQDRAAGTTMQLQDNSGTIIYTSGMCTNQNGSTTYANGTGYLYHTFFPTITTIPYGSNSSPSLPYRSYNQQTGAYTGTTSMTVQQVGSVNGEWLQIQSSVPVVISNYTFSAAVWSHSPKTYYIVGSNDGSTWFPIQYSVFTANPFNQDYSSSNTYITVNSSSIQSFTGNITTTVTTTTYPYTTNAYFYFRLVTTSIGGNPSGINDSNTDSISIAEWFVNFTPASAYFLCDNSITPSITVKDCGTQIVTGASITTASTPYSTNAYTYFRLVATSLFTGTALEIGEWFVNFAAATPNAFNSLTMSNSGQNMMVTSTGIVSPNTKTSSATWTTPNGITWTSSASSLYPGAYSYHAFNMYTHDWAWNSSGYYNQKTGVYTGTTSTSVQQVGSVSGEWLQIQSSSPLIMYNYKFRAGGWWQIPKTYYIVGSNDGLTWYPIQSCVFTSSPFNTTAAEATTYIIVNSASVQSFTGNATTTVTTTTYSYTTNPYLYFRLIAQSLVGNIISGTDASNNDTVSIGEWFINFINYSVYTSSNYGSVWSTLINPANVMVTSGNGKYTIGYTKQILYLYRSITSSSYTTPLLSGINASITDAALSFNGQYMLIVTGGVENNVFYSTDYGSTFSAVTIGSLPLIGCTVSADGSYATISNATTVYTLNRNTKGYSVTIGNAAGQTNQGLNAIAIGNSSGQTNQSAGSVILNASGSALDSYETGFYTSYIASITESVQTTASLLGYGTDSQIIQTGASISADGTLSVASLDTTIDVVAQAIYLTPSPENSAMILKYFAKVANTVCPNRVMPFWANGSQYGTISGLPGGYAYIGGVLVPDGRVIFVPYSAGTVGIFNPFTNTYSTAGSGIGGSAYFGGLLIPDGRVLFVPNNSTKIGFFNPSSNTYSTSETMSPAPGDYAFSGGVLAPDGRVIFCPRGATSICFYDTTKNTYGVVPGITMPGGTKYYGIVLLTDGRVLFVPHHATTIGIFNPFNNSYITTGKTPGGAAFGGGVLLNDGRVLFVPGGYNKIGIYNPFTDVYSEIQTSPSATGFFTGVLLPDGRVAFAPTGGSVVGFFNPVTNEYKTVSIAGSSTEYQGSTFLPDGRIVFTPYIATTIGLFNTGMTAPPEMCMSPYFNKL